MMHPKEMTMVRIISPAKNVRTVIETIYNMKLLHIVDFKKQENDFFDIGSPFKEATFYSEQLISVRSIISKLGISGTPQHLKNFKDAERKFSEIKESFRLLVDKMENLKSEEAAALQELNNPLTDLDITKSRIKEYKSLAVFAGTVKSPIEPKLKSDAPDHILMQAKAGRQIAFVLFVKKNIGEKVRFILASAGFVEHQIPSSTKSEINEKLSKLRNEIAFLEKQLSEFKEADSQFLVDYEFALVQLNEKAEVPLRFASSKNAFIATGWVPAKEAEKLKQNLSKVTGDKVSVELLHGKNPPTVLENPKAARPFEFLLNLYTLPRYYEIDPTILMFVTFPLFFGFMLGDVGYGLVAFFGIFLLERMLSSGIRPLTRILMIASLATVAFGFIFGEVFGHEFLEHPMLNRAHDINTMMLVAIAVGVVHVNLGFVLGIINEMKHHNFFVAFLKKGSWIAIQISVALLVYGYMQTSQSLQMAGVGATVVSLLMLLKGEGMKIVELPALLSNMLSYIRLYAIGLSSVALATVINDLSFGFFSQGGLFIAVGAVILFVGHFVNLLLGLLGPFLHSLRLHYVEFFQKFYEGGGYRYSPFGLVKILGGR